ncbi:MAG TPA: hypothetical protein PLX97_13475 [Gemmatales bacterium]|nr:hypothetical protein [Gemmatales bacterium]
MNITGRFEEGPDFELVRPVFQAAHDAAARVDVAPESEYLEAWHEWQTACKVIEELGLTYGDHRIPLESFTMDSSGNLEFSLALWWLMTHGEWANT